MDTRFLETFLAVADEGSLAAAARRLNVTSAAVAQRIRALEAEVGASLLARAGRVVRPTPAGRAIIAASRRFLSDLRDLTAAAADVALSGELRVGAIGTALTGLMPDILERFFARHQAIDLYLEPGPSMDLYARVLDGRLDAAVIVRPQFAPPKELVVMPLRSEPMVVLAPAAAAGSEPLRLLGEAPFIRYDRNQWGGRVAEAFLRRHGIRVKERFELDALDAIAVMVSRGLGVSLVPDWSPPWPATAPLARIPLPGPAPAREIVMVWLADSPRARLIGALADMAMPSS